MKRRHFVGGLAAAAGVAACSSDDAGCETTGSAAEERFDWSMVTSWPPGFPGLGKGADNLAKRIGEA